MHVINPYTGYRTVEFIIMLSQASGYAATALGFIAAMGGKSALVKIVAETCDIPSAYLAKIINALSHKGLVITQRGVGGGVSLARPPQEISLREICVALDDPITEPRCMFGHIECSDDRACPAHAFCAAHREKLAVFLDNTSVADIAAFETRRRWGANQPQAKAAEVVAPS
jgi:Rrf2 family iron-sulfur cluster assembly transcriptional regulator